MPINPGYGRPKPSMARLGLAKAMAMAQGQGQGLALALAIAKSKCSLYHYVSWGEAVVFSQDLICCTLNFGVVTSCPKELFLLFQHLVVRVNPL